MYDLVDERGVPVSRGIPMVVRIAAVVGIIAIFAVGAFVILEASYGHAWPYQNVLRIPLSGGSGT